MLSLMSNANLNPAPKPKEAGFIEYFPPEFIISEFIKTLGPKKSLGPKSIKDCEKEIDAEMASVKTSNSFFI